jgi:Domain of unknown function (DUF4386)
MTPGDRAWIRRTSRLAGGLYLAMMPFAFFGIVYVPSVLVVPGDAAATARNIMGSEWLFRSGMVGHLVGQLIFVLLVLTLYQLLRPVNRDYAVLMITLALLGVPIALVNEVNHFAVLRLLSGLDYLEPLTRGQIEAQAMLFLDLRRSGLVVAQVFWGLWLMPLGYLVFRSGFLPRLLGVLLIIAGVGYLFDVAVVVLLPNIDATISQFTFIGELLFPLWLVFKAVNVDQWQRVALTNGVMQS